MVRSVRQQSVYFVKCFITNNTKSSQRNDNTVAKHTQNIQILKALLQSKFRTHEEPSNVWNAWLTPQHAALSACVKAGSGHFEHLQHCVNNDFLAAVSNTRTNSYMLIGHICFLALCPFLFCACNMYRAFVREKVK